MASFGGSSESTAESEPAANWRHVSLRAGRASSDVPTISLCKWVGVEVVVDGRGDDQPGSTGGASMGVGALEDMPTISLCKFFSRV